MKIRVTHVIFDATNKIITQHIFVQGQFIERDERSAQSVSVTEFMNQLRRFERDDAYQSAHDGVLIVFFKEEEIINDDDTQS